MDVLDRVVGGLLAEPVGELGSVPWDRVECYIASMANATLVACKPLALGLISNIKHLHLRSAKREMSLLARVARLALINALSTQPVRDLSSEVVVSLTTYGERSNTVYLAIESIARGSMKPNRLILWIDDLQLLDRLPRSLRRLEARGLEIRHACNYGPHTKYYGYVAAEQPPDLPLVTADDDILYPMNWLERLVASFREHPSDVHCYRARVVVLGPGDEFAPYSSWPLCTSTRASELNYPTGVSGVLYPCAVLDELRSAGLRFQQCSPYNDDIWLHRSAIRAGTRIRQIDGSAIHFPQVPGTERSALWTSDNGVARNDEQIRATYGATEIELLHRASEKQPEEK